MNKKYTYTQIVKIVGHKVINKFDNGQITLGKFMDIFEQKLKENSKWKTMINKLRFIPSYVGFMKGIILPSTEF